MRKSLRTKIVFIMLLLIVVLMTVVLSFFIWGVRDFFSGEFNKRIESAFSDTAMISGIEEMADMPNGAERIAEVIRAYSGNLGIDMSARVFYILDGTTAQRLAGAEFDPDSLLEITPTIMSALESTEGESYVYTGSYDDCLDAAVAFSGEDGRYIIYIRDDRSDSEILSSRILTLIIESVVLGFAVAAVISLVLGQTLLSPIRGMTKAAEAMAGGDFSMKIPVESEDEIGTLADAFNTMAAQLESNIDKLRTEEQRRRDFVANVSHELKTPLTSVRAYTEAVQTEWDRLSGDERIRMLETVLHESDRMASIVQDLLQLSRFDADRVSFMNEEYDIGQCLRDVYTAIIPLARAKSQELTIDIPDKLPLLTGDKDQIEQVFVNIFTNAVKYTGENGVISVTAICDQEYISVAVSDTGIGIPEEDLGHIFDRFFRVDKARSREKGGTGLGLSIAWEIISRHGGAIDVESEPGAGSTFTIRLPLKRPQT